MKRFGPLVRAALAALLAACAGAKRRAPEDASAAVLQVEGWAKAAPGMDEAALKAAASLDARRDAAAKALRALLPSSVLSERSEQIESRILSDPSRFIARERVLEASAEGGYYKVRAEEGVLFSRLAEDLRGLGLLPSDESDSPRLGLALAGPQEARDALKRFYEGQGLVFSDVSSGNFAPGAELALSSAAAYGASKGLRLLIAGRAELLDQGGVSTKDFRSREARLRLWVLDVPRLALAGSSDQRALGSGPSDDIASGKALSSAVEAASQETAPAVAKSLASSERIYLKVSGLRTPEELQKLLAWLRQQPATRGASFRSYADGAAVLSFSARSVGSEELAALMLREPGFKYEVRSVLEAGVELERR